MFRRIALLLIVAVPVFAQRTQKPPLHGAHWMAVTGKPLAATAGAMIFQKGGNAVDAAAAMIAATCTMWDTLSWGGETQALIYNPTTQRVVGINALGIAPTGATPDFYRSHSYKYPPEYGPLAAVTPGTPGGVMLMIAEFGKLSLKDDLAPAIEMADGYPIERQAADTIERDKARLKQWSYSRALFLTHAGSRREAPEPGEMFRQPDLAATLRKLVEAEQDALKHGKSRKDAIYAAFDRFYKGDIAREIVRSVQEQGGLFTMDDFAKWRPRIEEPVQSNYRGIDVYKLTAWTQGPAMLQSLNILENFDLRSMGYNSSRYINTVYQAMSLAFADRDFYYGDSPDVPLRGLLSKDYAKERAKLIRTDRNDPAITAGDPYPFQGAQNPFLDLLKNWPATANKPALTRAGEESVGAAALGRSAAGEGARRHTLPETDDYLATFYAGTTSVEAADAEGWAVSVTPSGGWLPAVIAGHSGIGLSQRASVPACSR